MPERTCIGCRKKREVGEMVRICLDENGQLHSSTDSKGRGAWICKNGACFKAAMAKGRIERALRVKSIPDAQKQLSRVYEALGF